MDSLDIISSNKFQEILNHAYSVQQPRSNFQLENFVIGQHDTEAMQFFQVCLEISESAYNLRVAKLELEKMKIRYNRLVKSDDEIDNIDAQIVLLGIERTEVIIDASISELKTLISLYEKFPVKYTRDDIERDQQDYWSERLLRQAALEQVSVSTSQSEHFNSLRQAGLIEVTNGSISWVNRPALAESRLPIEHA